MEKITSRKKLILFGCSGLGVNILNIIMGSYLTSALVAGGFVDHISEWTYLGKDIVVAGLWAIFVFLAKALDGIIDLPLATFADGLKTKLGRRKTAILIGYIPMIISYLLFLIPLKPEATYLNTIWFGLLLCIFYSCYTLTMLTYYAAFAEVCKDERDTLFLSNTKSICDVVYFSLCFALIPVFISLNINIRIVALIFLPLALTMLIPFFLLKENREAEGEIRRLTLINALSTSFKDKAFIIWMCACATAAIGLQLFLGGINELFSSTGLNMTVVMASSFAPVPLTIMLYNKLTKKHGIAVSYRFVLTMFSIGMAVMLLCYYLSGKVGGGVITAIAIFGGVIVSFAIGAFFSVTYVVPTGLARRQFDRTGESVSSMYFAVQGLFEGIAAGIATGPILVSLKDNNVIMLLPIIVIIACAGAFAITYAFPDEIKFLGKEAPVSQNATETETV